MKSQRRMSHAGFRIGENTYTAKDNQAQMVRLEQCEALPFFPPPPSNSCTFLGSIAMMLLLTHIYNKNTVHFKFANQPRTLFSLILAYNKVGSFIYCIFQKLGFLQIMLDICCLVKKGCQWRPDNPEPGFALFSKGSFTCYFSLMGVHSFYDEQTHESDFGPEIWAKLRKHFWYVAFWTLTWHTFRSKINK